MSLWQKEGYSCKTNLLPSFTSRLQPNISPHKLVHPAWIPRGQSFQTRSLRITRGAHTILTLYTLVFSLQYYQWYQQQIAPRCFLQSLCSQLCKNLQASTTTDDFFCIFCVCIYYVPSPHEKILNVIATSVSFQETAVVRLTLNRYNSKLRNSAKFSTKLLYFSWCSEPQPMEGCQSGLQKPMAQCYIQSRCDVLNGEGSRLSSHL